MRHGTGGVRGGGEGRKINMRGDIHHARSSERINRLARAHGLQAIAKAAFRWAVINQQSRAAMAGKPRAKASCEAKCRFIHFAHGTFGRGLGRGKIARHFNKGTISNEAFTPSDPATNKLPNWQRIQKLIGQKDHGCFG